jgi:3-hydroxymyristoyl/3-hydroxydecanoyl-(acyl carrier protein) dehydratase
VLIKKQTSMIFTMLEKKYAEGGGHQMNFEEIVEVLPHGREFVFIDKLLDFSREQQSVKCSFYVSSADSRLKGHFKRELVYPGVFQLESMAQASGLLLYKTALFDNVDVTVDACFLSSSRMSFGHSVLAGDTIDIFSRVKRTLGESTEFTVSVYVKRKCVSKGVLVLTVVKQPLGCVLE